MLGLEGCFRQCALYNIINQCGNVYTAVVVGSDSKRYVR